MRRDCRERFPCPRLQKKPLVNNPYMHHGTCVTHMPWCMSGSLTRGGQGKCSWHSRRMHNPQFSVLPSISRFMSSYSERRSRNLYCRVIMRYDRPCYHTIFTLFFVYHTPHFWRENEAIQHQFCQASLESSHHFERNKIACNFLAAVTLAIQVCFVKGVDISIITVYLIVNYAWFSIIEISFTLISFSGQTSLIGKKKGENM